MSHHAAFLRGMNLGRRRITNDELCRCFTEMGFTDVSAFLASGNVVFESAVNEPVELTATIEEGLERSLQYAVPTFVRSADEVRAIASFRPFDRDRGEEGGKPQVALLPREPSDGQVEEALRHATKDDLLAIQGRELYWLPRGSILDSEIDLARLEKIVGPWTARTARTLERLAAKFFPD